MSIIQRLIKLVIPLVYVAICAFFVSCEEKESSLGSSLVDPATLYNGTRDTVYLEGYTVYDDSLMTSDYAEALVGSFDDAVLGMTSAFLYAQIALSDDNGLNLSSQIHFDSVVLMLVLNDVFTSSSSSLLNAHFRIYQLQEAFSDDDYYGNDSIRWDIQTCFLDLDTTISSDTRSIRLKLDTNTILPFLTENVSSSEFLANLKGIRVSINEFESNDVMFSVNMNAVDTKLTLHCSKDSVDHPLNFILGHKTGLSTRHFVQFRHRYASTPISIFENVSQRGDTIGASSEAYLKPMGGTRVVFKLDTAWYNQFRKQHPYAVVNYAELMLPVKSGDTNTLPKRLLAYKGSGSDADLVCDAIDASRYAGFDGYFHPDGSYYRMLVVRHLQQILTEGVDNGTAIAIDARRSTTKSVVLNGSNKSARPRIAFVYSE